MRIVARNPTCRPTLFQHLNDVGAAEREARLQRRREPGEGIDDRQHPKLPTGGELVVDESIAQVSFDRVAGRRSSRSLAFTRRLGALLHNCRPNSW